MKILESMRSSFKSLFHNRMRSFLTMLGVIIGVFSVIMLTSISEGIKRQVTAEVESLGANLLYVIPGKVAVQSHNQTGKLGFGMSKFAQNKSNLTYEDVLGLKHQKYIAAATGIFNKVDKLDKLDLWVSTIGVDEDFNKIRNLPLKYGRFINRKERETGTAVTVIGDEVNKELFYGKNSIGKSFTLNGKPYQVIGILQYKKYENLGPQRENINTEVYLPVTEMLNRSADKYIDHLITKATAAKSVNSAERTIKKVLTNRHHRDEDFSIFKQQDMLDVINNILGILTAALGGIAAISLIVGGIGIMNIMLVTVAERTREIGIRKAIGAKRRDILIQFLIEAIVLSLSGGLAGLIVGIIGAQLLPRLFPIIRTAISIPASVIALLFAFFVGGFFGVYPATKAADLDPIDALRSE